MVLRTELWIAPSGRHHWVSTRALENPTIKHIVDYSHHPEVVRMLIDRYGRGRFRGAVGFVRDVVRGAGVWPWVPFGLGDPPYRLDAEDGVGSLWRVPLLSDEPIHVVEVIDSAPMKNGRHKHHWLRVPPTVTTARGAVAWTFGLRADQYHPAKET